MKNHKVLRALCEGAIMVALAQVLGYLKFYRMPYGGSVTLAMVPLFFFAYRWGVKEGLLACFVYGLLQFTLDGAYAYTWQAIILDYLLAYTGLAVCGAFRGRKHGIYAGVAVGTAVRYIAHVLSGVYVWAEYMPDTFLGLAMTSPWIYSPLYNAVYMGLNLVLCLAAFAALSRPMRKYIEGRDIA